ncbi:transcriptional regulator [Deinococcus radiomollis]|uniref:transcriptional regulator n=1 Tax=Deinococcus radiomollis TaxID=468916 RepID=UPI0038913BC0
MLSQTVLLGLLTAGWSAAQTAFVQTSAPQISATQPSAAQSVAASPGALPLGTGSLSTGPLGTPPGVGPDPAQGSAASSPATSPIEALISALKRSWLAEARGEAVLELVFPPSTTPLRRARALPRLTAVAALIRRNFVVTVGAATETVAGRAALRYTLTPRNAHAARWTIWTDQKWKVPLAYQERMPGGSLARRAELTTVDPALTKLTATASVPLSGSPALKKILFAALPGLKLPAGFEPLSAQVRTDAAGTTSTEVLLTDGLNLLALVVSPRPVQAASGVAVRRLKGQAVWLVGNLPQGTLESALAGIQRLNLQAVSNLPSRPGTSGAPAASDQ